MIVKTYRCDLCKREVSYPRGGYRLTFSGDGAIGFVWLDDKNPRATETIICKSCEHGLGYAMSHVPVDDEE